MAVVFGGRTAEARDARVRSLIDNNINIAAVNRTAPPVVEGWETAEARAKDNKEAKDVKEKVVAAAPIPRRAEPAFGSTDPIKPNPVKTFTVQVGAMHTASLSPLPSDSRKLMPAPATASPAKVTTVAIVKQEPLPAAATGHQTGVLGVLPAKVASAGDNVPVAAIPRARGQTPRGGWMIQVGAFPDESEAKQRLVAAQGKAKDQLGQADPFTERVAKGDKSLFRARFAGLDKDQAETACKNLKRSEIPCMLLKN